MYRQCASIFCFFFLLASEASTQPRRGQQPLDTLAMVGSIPILARDVLERIELMPFELKSEEQDFDKIKEKAVASLVGEKLLVMSQPLTKDQTSRFIQTMETVLQKLFVRDALYKREVHDKVVITEKEIHNGLALHGNRRKILIIYPSSMKEAAKIIQGWKECQRAHRSIHEYISTLPFRRDTLGVSFGSADPPLEKAVFSLKDTMEISKPVESIIYGLVVLTVLEKELDAHANELSAAERLTAVKNILLEQKENAAANSFIEKTLKAHHMAADSSLFRRLTIALRELMTLDSMTHRLENGYRYIPEDIFRLLRRFESELDTPLVRGSFGTLKLEEFLENLFYYDFHFSSLKSRTFAITFFDILRKITEGEIIAQEGIRRNLQSDNEVIRDIALWTSYWKSRDVVYMLQDSVTISDWESYVSLWRKKKELVEGALSVKVQEVLCSDSFRADSLFRLIQDGESMDSIARTYTQRIEWRMNNGKSGWLHFSDYREILTETMVMSLGEIKKVQYEGKNALLRLMERKITGNRHLLDSLIERECISIRQEHQRGRINQYLAHEAIRQHVEIYSDRIRKVDIKNINMVTIRMIGFGGKMNAAPLLVPQWEWVREWERLKRQFQ